MVYLVTGGAGFIGSHIAGRLLQRGDEVVVLDNFNDYYDPALKQANIEQLRAINSLEVIQGDVRDAPLVEQVVAEHGITHVVHMASLANVRASVEQAAAYVAVNVQGTVNLLEAARKNDVKQFVMASTSSVYGETDQVPFVETDAADRPLASYPASKRASEILGHTYTHLFGLNFTALRFFNVYGPAGRPDMMPMKLMNAAMDGTLIKLFNKGEIYRDWTYIEDVVDGVLAAVDKPLGYEIFNLGFGSPISLTAFVEIIEELSGRQINKENVPAPLSEPPITYSNNQKARDLLGFEPKVDIHQGLQLTWEWFCCSQQPES